MTRHFIRNLSDIAAFAVISPAAFAGDWIKYEKNPVLGGGDIGVVFDICALKSPDGFVMYSSWRPQRRKCGLPT